MSNDYRSRYVCYIYQSISTLYIYEYIIKSYDVNKFSESTTAEDRSVSTHNKNTRKRSATAAGLTDGEESIENLSEDAQSPNLEGQRLKKQLPIISLFGNSPSKKNKRRKKKEKQIKKKIKIPLKMQRIKIMMIIY